MRAAVRRKFLKCARSGDVKLISRDGIGVGLKWVYGGLEDVKGWKRSGRLGKAS